MKKEALSFLHDAGARRDPKMIKLRRTLGRAACSMYWDTIEYLRETSTDCSLAMADIDDLAFELRENAAVVHSFVTACVQIGLFRSDGDRFWSDSLRSRVDRYKQIGAKRAESARKRWEKDDEEKVGAQLQSNCNANPNITQPNIIQFKPTQKNSEGVQGEFSTEPRPRGFEFAPDAEPEIGSGRRPMRDFPHVRLTEAELDEIFQAFVYAELPQRFWMAAFIDANDYLQRRPGVSAFARLMGFSMTNAMDQAAKAQKLKPEKHRKSQNVINQDATIAAVQEICAEVAHEA